MFGNIYRYQKLVNHLKRLLELLSYDIFDVEKKPEVTDKLVSFDELTLLEIRRIVNLMAADDLFCRLVMYALIFSEYSIRTPF